MFTACPHCQFLVARDPHAAAPPADCPRCGKPLATGSEAPAAASPSLATFLNVANVAAVQADASPGDRSRVIEDTTTRAPTPPTTPAEDAPPDEPPRDAADAPASETDDPAPPATPAPSDAPAHDADATRSQDPAHDDVAQQEASAHVAIATPGIAPVPARRATGPRFLQRTRTTPVHARRARWQWTAAIALALLLCVQVVLADRDRLAAQAGWRPIVLALCGAFRCDVPTWREPVAFTMLSRDVRPVAGAPGTLQAQATFRNDARWAQAWPVILLTLKDADGRTLGARALQPGDYLPEGEAASPIGPGQSAQMAVQVREPSANVVAFSFDFR